MERRRVKYLLDTHTWIWWHTRPDKLSRKVKGLISDPDRYEELLLSAISIWEFCKLLEKGRIGISCAPEEWLAQALAVPALRLVPLSPSIAYRSTVLPNAPSADPADQIIIATARWENATILTKDGAIRRYRHVRTNW
jgi:PIN domain nuclease of toxin-antitoxin system